MSDYTDKHLNVFSITDLSGTSKQSDQWVIHILYLSAHLIFGDTNLGQYDSFSLLWKVHIDIYTVVSLVSVQF